MVILEKTEKDYKYRRKHPFLVNCFRCGVIVTLLILFTACPNAAGNSQQNAGGNLPLMYTVAIDTPPDGTLTAKINDQIFTGGQVLSGTKIVFVAVPDNSENNNVDFWEIQGATVVSGGDAGENTVTLSITSPTTVRVVFKGKHTQHTKLNVHFKVENSIGGEIKAFSDGVPISSGALVARGKTVSFNAIPWPDCEINNWTNATAGNPNTAATLTVNQNTTVKVKFKSKPYNVYVVGTSGNSVYYWKNNIPSQLSSSSMQTQAPTIWAKSSDVYIGGWKKTGNGFSPWVWKNKTKIWPLDQQQGVVHDIYINEEDIYIALIKKDGSNIDKASVVNMTTNKMINLDDGSGKTYVYAITGSDSAVYAVGENKKDVTALLWKIESDKVTKTVLSKGRGFGICLLRDHIYVVGSTAPNPVLWKISKADLNVCEKKFLPQGFSAHSICALGDTLYIAGSTFQENPVLWKVENEKITRIPFPVNANSIWWVRKFGVDLFISGSAKKAKDILPVWWKIPGSIQKTADIPEPAYLGKNLGHAEGIYITPQ